MTATAEQEVEKSEPPTKRRVWWAGWNRPAELPTTEPCKFHHWQDAKRYLALELSLEGEFHYFTKEVPYADYMKATAILSRADNHTPLSFYYAGWVWWIADLPE